MIDGNEADDKIIAVMKQDEIYNNFQDLSECPVAYIERLRHYFLTYKDMPGHTRRFEITHTYGKEEAHEVIRRSQEDYHSKFGKIETKLSLAAFEAITKGKMLNESRTEKAKSKPDRKK